jgi:hypothetical protein
MTRIQLSLYVPLPHSDAIEAVRRVVDPVQFGLIPAHVTLCREDELASFAGWRERLETLPPEAIRLHLRFGRAVSFSGHGILLQCMEGIEAYRELRRRILGSSAVREMQPHLTLAHPRNPQAPGNTIEATFELPPSFEIAFDSVKLIEQVDSGPWKTLAIHP